MLPLSVQTKRSLCAACSMLPVIFRRILIWCFFMQKMEVQFFAAHTLYTKIRMEWYSTTCSPMWFVLIWFVIMFCNCRLKLGTEQKTSIRGMLIELIRHCLGKGQKLILSRVALAVAAIGKMLTSFSILDLSPAFLAQFGHRCEIYLPWLLAHCDLWYHVTQFNRPQVLFSFIPFLVTFAVDSNASLISGYC